MDRIKVLLTDGNHRKTLAAVRALGKHGYHVIAGEESKKLNICKYSRYCHESFTYPGLYSSGEEFLNYIEKYIDQNRVNVVLPMDDATTEIFSKNLPRFQDIVCIPVPDYDIFQIGWDKAQTIRKAKDSGLDYPKTLIVTDLEMVDSIHEDLEYPVVIKPTVSSGSRGISYVSNKEELKRSYLAVHEMYPYPLIQEFIPFEGRVQLQVLMLLNRERRVIASCVQQFLRQFPVEGGPGTFWKTIDYPELEKATAEFLKNINWYGIACVEYIIDSRTGKPLLMELNPRFWGTLNLSIQVGVNFPVMLVKMALGEKNEDAFNNRYDEYCQWFLPGDLLNFIFNKKRFNQEFGYFFKRPDKFYHVTFLKEDPLPVIATIFSIIEALFSRKTFYDIFKRGK